jgi:hypothetical protein
MTDFTDGVFREGKKIVSCAANPAERPHPRTHRASNLRTCALIALLTYVSKDMSRRSPEVKGRQNTRLSGNVVTSVSSDMLSSETAVTSGQGKAVTTRVRAACGFGATESQRSALLLGFGATVFVADLHARMRSVQD